MINKELVHLTSVVLWGLFGIVVGVVTIIYNFNSIWVWVAIITAVAGNSLHLISMSLSKQGLQVTSEEKK